MDSSENPGRPSFALLLAGLVLVAAAVWLLSRPDVSPGEDVRAAGATPMPVDHVDVEGAVPAAARESAGVEPAPASNGAPTLPRRVAPVRPADEPEDVLVTGAAVRVDGAGAEHAGDDGSFAVAWRQYGERTSVDVVVTGGRFSFEAPHGSPLFVTKLVLADAAVSLDARSYTIPSDRFLVLRGHGMSAVGLRVLAAEDRRELEHVDVVSAGAFVHQRAHGHPGEDPEGVVVAKGAASPILLRPSNEGRGPKRVYWVRAPERAWTSVTLDHSSGGEREVLLPLAGALEVVLLGNAAWLEPKVRLWPPNASRWEAYAYAERELGPDDTATFESLAPGTYDVSAERGWAQDRSSFGRAVVEVREGVREQVRIDIDLPAKPEPVELAGTLSLPPGWSRRGVKLELEAQQGTTIWMPEALHVALDEMEALDAGGERFAWRARLPGPGAYGVEVQPLLVRRFLSVPAGGLANVELEVPPPADVEVRVVEDSTGAELEVDKLHWSTVPIEEIVATPLYSAVRNHDLGCIAFRAPAEPLRIVPVGMALQLVGEEPVVAQPGLNRVELRVRRRIGVRFRFVDGDSSVPWSWSWRLRADRVDGEARDVARSVGMLWFRDEGTYALRASAGIPGYRPLDGATFEVRALGPGEEIPEVVVPLERL